MQTQITANDYSFPVSLEPIFTKRGTEIPRQRAVVRLDTFQPLSVVSDRYQLYTHKHVMDSVKPFIKALGEPQTNYALERNGARLIATHTFKTVPVEKRAVDSQVALQIHVINSYNSTTSLEFRLGALVLKCMNGMTINRHLFNLRFRHLGESWTGQLPDPKLVVSAFNQASLTWEDWSKTKVTASQKQHIVDTALETGVLPERYYERERQQFEAATTLWETYNALTFTISHCSKRMLVSGKINRLDRLNQLFESAAKDLVAA